MSVSCCLQSLSRQKDGAQEEFIKPEQTDAAPAENNNNEHKPHKHISGVSPDNASGSSGKSISENNADSGHPDSPDDDGLGPLPPNWEKAYTDKGEPYFIDHNSGTSHWLDPRLSRIQKQRPEDCDEGELPFGWERIDDPHYGTYYIDHVNRRTQYENPVLVAKAANQSADAIMTHGMGNGALPAPPVPPAPSTFPRNKKAQNDRPFFTRDPTQLKGEKLQAKLVKSTKGLGFTIVGGDDSEEEFLQIKSVVPNGPAWLDGKLKTGDVLVYVNGTCVLGFTHHDMVTMFQGIGPGEVVGLDVCRGYPLPFDPDDPNTEIVTTVAVTSPEQGEWANELERQRSTSAEADTANSMPDLWRGQPQEERINNQNRPGSADLLMSDHKMENGVHNGTDTNSEISDMRFNPQDLVTIPIVKGGMGFGFTIADSAYGQKVKKILDRPRCKNLNEGDILVEINNLSVRNMSHGEVVQVLKDCARGQEAAITIQRGILSSPSKNKFKKNKDEGNMRPKSGFLFRSKTPTAELFATQEKEVVPMRPKTPIVDTRNMSQKNWNSDIPTSSPFTRNDLTRASLGGNMRQPEHSEVGGGHDRSGDHLSEQFSGAVNISEGRTNRSHSPGRELDYNYDPNYPGYNYNYNQNTQNYNQYGGYNGYVPSGYDPGYGYSGYTEGYNRGGVPQMGYSPGNTSNGYRSGSLPRGRKESTSFEQSEPVPTNIRWPRPERRPWEDVVEITVTLLRHDSGFGFRIVGGTEEGSQVSIGHIVPGGAADLDGRLFSGDEIVAVDGQSVLGASHHVVVGMMGHAGHRGQVALTVRRRQPQEGYREGYPYDVTVSRLENEGFGFVIISSVSRAGSTIGRIIPGSPAERCGRLQVGDRILAVNHVDINSLHHGDIVNLIKESGYSVTLTVGPPIDDTSSTASTSHRSSTSSMVTAQARPTVVPPSDSVGSSQSSLTVHSIHAARSGDTSEQVLSGQVVGEGALSRQGEGVPPPGSALVRGGHHYEYYQEDQEVNSHLAEEEQYFAVELQRGQRGFGFSIRGGREFHSMPLFVLRMAVDGPAAMDGRLRVGDQLIEINSQSTKNMTHGEAIELIKNGGMTVRLLVRRGKAPNSAFLDQAGLSPTSPTPVSVGRPVSSLSQPGPSQPGGPPGPGPVSHSSPRYPPQYGGGQVPVSQYNGGYQQPPPAQYWGYQQAVE